MKITLFILFAMLLRVAHSQVLNPEAESLKTAFEMLSANKQSLTFQKNYISAFPSDTKTFLEVFQNKKLDQLCLESHKYIDAFEECAEKFPRQGIYICARVGKNLVWDTDAVEQFQHVSLLLANKNLIIFISIYRQLNAEEQDSLAKFYADNGNHNRYPEYQELIDKLTSVGEDIIAGKLEIARANRKNKSDH